VEVKLISWHVAVCRESLMFNKAKRKHHHTQVLGGACAGGAHGSETQWHSCAQREEACAGMGGGGVTGYGKRDKAHITFHGTVRLSPINNERLSPINSSNVAHTPTSTKVLRVAQEWRVRQPRRHRPVVNHHLWLNERLSCVRHVRPVVSGEVPTGDTRKLCALLLTVPACKRGELACKKVWVWR
jgi:hypothetical protein